MLRTIHLHGRLGKRFGSSHMLDVASVGEAVRALDSQLPGFRDYMLNRKYLVTTGSGVVIGEKQINMNLGGSSEIHVTPAGMVSGLETILLVGTLLFAAASVVMVLSMPKTPTPASREEATKTDSFIFDGPQNSTEQGHPVPLIYGRFEVGSIVASAGISTADVNEGSVSAPPGGVPWDPFALFMGSTPGIPGSPAGSQWVIVEKGGKGGSGTARAAQEDPNSLQSKAIARILDVIGEGEIVGLVNGLKSVKFDGTPVQNEDDSYNFAGLAIEQRLGLPDQDYLPGFPQTENTVSVEQQVKVLTGPVVRTIDDDNVTLAHVTLSLPQLYVQDTTNGDLKQTSVEMAIDVQADGGGYINVASCVFQGKTNTGYQRTYEVRLPPGNSRQIRVRRITADSNVASVANETHWDSYTEIVEAKLSYPDTALIGITIDARQFGSNIPTRSYDVKGLIIEVPTNYDPETRAYTGLWDGTFKRAWTDNPAWVLRDIVVNRRYGLGARVPSSSIDKWLLYSIAQYCDQLVPDGFGGQQPRYTINCVINSEASAYDLLAAIASNFRAWTYWGSGSVIVVQDRPDDPTALITPANAVDGRIKYNRITPLNKRRSVALVYWNDPEDNYRLTPEVYEDPDLIRRFGRRSGDEVTAFGVTNKGQAHRMARWVLEDESQGSNSLADYGAGEDHAFIGPGHIISVEDPMFTGLRRGGRLVSATSNGVTLDRNFVVAAGQSYTLRTVLPDGEVVRRPITNTPGDTNIMSLGGTAFVTPPLPGAVWTIESEEVVNRQFRLRSRGGDKAPYDVQAVLHDPTKYERVEQARDLSTLPFTSLPEGGLIAPSGLTLTEFLARDGDATIPSAQVSWTASRDPRVTFYQAQYQRPDGQFEGFADSLDANREIRGTVPGYWTIRVRAVDSLGRKTEWVQKTFNLVSGSGPLPHVSDLVLLADEDALTPLLHWSVIADARPLSFRIRFNPDENDLETATILGETSALIWPVSAPGHYWVSTFFTDYQDDEPPHIEITAVMFAEVKWTRVVGRPASLNDLDSIAAAAITQTQEDITDLYASLGISASAEASAAAAEASRIASETAAGNASSSASAASGSATSASSSATAAGNSATSSSNSATAASVSASNASSSASTSSSQASIATAQAAAAQTSALLAASIGPGALNKNPMFTDYSTSPGQPAGWAIWSNAGNGGQPSRVTGEYGVDYAIQDSNAAATDASQNQGSSADHNTGSVGLANITPNQYLVIEGEVQLVSGSLRGAGMLLQFWTSSSYLSDGRIDFFTEADSTGAAVGTGTPGRTYRFSKLVRAPNNTALHHAAIYRMTNWNAFASGTTSAKTLKWFKCAVRPATAEEIRSNTAIPTLQATVSSQSGVLATHDGKLQAYLSLTTAAGASAAAVRLVSDSYAGSLLELQADAIRLGSSNLAAMAIVGGQVYFYGKVTAGSITATELSSGTLITSSAQIGSAVVTTAKIADLAVTTGKIANLAVDTLKIANNAVSQSTWTSAAAAVTGWVGYGYWTLLTSVTFVVSNSSPTRLLYSLHFHLDATNLGIRARIDGVDFAAYQFDSVYNADSGTWSLTHGWDSVDLIVLPLANGTHTLTVEYLFGDYTSGTWQGLPSTGSVKASIEVFNIFK